jgi:hypothetical protein
VVKKVVAAAAAASGLVLAGAGLAVADSGKQAPMAHVGSDAGIGRVSGHNPKCVDSSTNINGRLPHSSQTHQQGLERHHPGPGENHEHPHAPEVPKDHNKSHAPHHGGHPQHHPPTRPGGGIPGHQGAPSKGRHFPGELARTGSSEELRLMLAGSTGLMLAGAVLMRRTRRHR